MFLFICIYLLPDSQSVSTNSQPSQSGLKSDFVHQQYGHQLYICLFFLQRQDDCDFEDIQIGFV